MAHSAHDAAASDDRLEQVLELRVPGCRMASGPRSRLRAALLRPGRSGGPGRARTGRPLRRRAVALESSPTGASRARCACVRSTRRLPSTAGSRRTPSLGRQRRHALSRRLGDDGGQPPRPDAAPDHSSAGRRRARRRRLAAAPAGRRGALHESFIHVEVDRVPEPARWTRSPPTMARVLGDVRQAVVDWAPIRRRVHDILAEARRDPAADPGRRTRRGRAFLAWLCRQSLHLHSAAGPTNSWSRTARTCCASCQARAAASCVRPADSEAGGPGSSHRDSPRCRRSCAHARRPELLVVTSRRRARRCTARYLDYIAVKRFGPDGRVCGEERFLGLFTSTAYSRCPADIPLLRRRSPASSSAPACPREPCRQGAREHPRDLPRDELFQTSTDDPLRIATGILHLGERQRSRLFVRLDPFERFVSCLIYAPRENYTTEAAREMAGAADQGLRRHRRRVQRASVGVGAGADPHHGAHPSGQVPHFDVRELEGGWSPRRGAGRRPQGRADRRPQRSARQRDAAPLRPASRRATAPRRRGPPCPTSSMAGLADAQPIAMTLYQPLEAPPGTLRWLLRRAAVC